MNVVVEHRRAQHDDEIVLTQLFHHAGADARQRAGELAVIFGEAAAARERARVDERAGTFGQPHREFGRAVAVDARADHQRRRAAPIEGRDERVERRRFGHEVGVDPAHRDCEVRTSQSSSGTETKVGPNGRCIAT